MRLLNSATLELHEFQGETVPTYAILSHTWGKDEVSFQDLKLPVAELESKVGYAKIKNSAALAITYGCSYLWIDTCCIDKTSSTELSEAINSMYRWYKNSEICFLYLIDVEIKSEENGKPFWDQFSSSMWFTRGWTLQELIAPRQLIFYTQDWNEIEAKSGILDTLARIAGIESSVLESGDPRTASVAQRMSWAANRKTTRVEDIAYSLLGW